MDFSSIMNESGYKFVQSPVIYKFPSQKFLNTKKSNASINRIGNMLFRREHPSQNNDTQLELHSILTGKDRLFEFNQVKEDRNEDKNQQPYHVKVSQQILTQNQNNNDHLYNKLNMDRKQSTLQRSASQDFPYYRKLMNTTNVQLNNILSPNKQTKLYSPNKQINLPPPFPPLSPHNRISQKKSSTINQQLTRLSANQLINKTQRQLLEKQVSMLRVQLKTYEQKIQQLNEQKQQWVRCKKRNQILQRQYRNLSEEFNRLKQANLDYSDSRFKSSQVQKVDLTDANNISDSNRQFDKTFDRNFMLKRFSSQQFKVNSRDLFELETKNKSLTNQITSLKQQLQGKILQLNQKDTDYSKLKQSLQSKVDLLQKDLYSLKSQKQSLLKQLSASKSQISRLKTQLSKSSNHTYPTRISSQSPVQQQIYRIELQLNQLKQHNNRLQQQKNSYISNYKLLKKQRQKQCKELKQKQQEILQSLKKLNKQLQLINEEKSQVQNLNKKLKAKIRELQDQNQSLQRKYNFIKSKQDQTQLNLQIVKQKQQLSLQNNFMEKYQELFNQKEIQFSKKIEKLTQSHDKKIQDIQKQNQKIKTQILRRNEEKIKQHQEKIVDLKKVINQKQAQIKELTFKEFQFTEKTKTYDQKIKRYEQQIQFLSQKEKSFGQELSKTQLKLRAYEDKIQALEQKIKIYEKKIIESQTRFESVNKQSQKTKSSLDQILEQREQKWSQMLQLKQKYLEANELVFQISTEKNSLKAQINKCQQQLLQKQEEKKLLKMQHEAQIQRYRQNLLTKQTTQSSLKNNFENLMVKKENQIKKQRAEIQGLLLEIVKLRQVKNHNYKLMEQQKSNMKIDQTVIHLWAIKQAQYENISRVFGIIRKEPVGENVEMKINSNQQRKADREQSNV